MSIPLLLPCPSAPLHSVSDRGKGTSALLHLGSFGSCQCPSKSALAKSPLLKSRKRSAYIPPIGYIPSIGKIPVVGQNTHRNVGSLTNYSFHTSPEGVVISDSPSPSLSGDHSLGIVLSSREVNFGNIEVSPLRESNCLPSSRNFNVSSVPFSAGFSPTSESITSSKSQCSPTSPTFPIRINDGYSNSMKNKFLPSSPTHSFSTRSTLHKSESTLIMPSLFSFFRSDSSAQQGGSRPGRLPRDSSSRSLNVTSRSPSPLIRKCHTVISLSSQGNQPFATNVVAKPPTLKKSKKFGIFRRLSPSKSAVFSTQSRSHPTSSIRKSTSTANALGNHRHRKSSGLSMLPHKEDPQEEEDALQHYAHITTSEELKEQGNTIGGCSRCASFTSIASRRQSTITNGGNDGIFCRLCLTDVSVRELYQLQLCQCRFCTYCMCMYATLKIREGEPVIECPDSNCDCRGELTLEELESLVGKELLSLHLKFRRDREVDLDPLKTWCPRPGCETVVSLSVPKLGGRPHCSCCPTCSTIFCAACSSSWHPGKPCLKNVGCYEVPLNDCIKRCPRCKVPIERDAGCAQMQCKKCKHVFCWYCLASLEDDFLLRHYDKGPCKNKLGHSRASVLLHRAQVVVIFAGFGLLLIIASPLLLFVGPCLLCKSCRSCSRPESDEDVSSV